MRAVSRLEAIEAWLRRLDPGAVDAGVALILAAAVVGTDAAQDHFNVVAVFAGVVVSASVAIRRATPVTAILLAGAGATVMGRSGSGSLIAPVAFALNYYTLGRRSAERGWSWIDPVVLALPIPAIATAPGTASPGNPLFLDVLSIWAFFIVIPFAAGRAVGGRARLNNALRVNAQRLEHEQRERARQAVAQERTRIARELHDVVAHGVSVMVIQTAAARRVAGRDPAAAAAALGAVESCGREALIDMRRMIGVLHRGDIELLGGATPGVAQLGKLAQRACASGMTVTVSVEGQPRPLSAALDLVVFRVVQEALTNAIKHAGPAQARVRVSFTADMIELEIADTGHGPEQARSAADAVGHGLIGMQERLTLYGGQLQTGRRRGGGFQVVARIPLIDPVPA